MNKTYVGEGKVVLLAGGEKIFADIAARFVGSERSLDEIIASPYSKEIVQNILNSNHLATLRHDLFVFGIEGYARVTETQLVRKQVGASYTIKTGRKEKGGKRSFDVVIPKQIEGFYAPVAVPTSAFRTLSGEPLSNIIPDKFIYMDADSDLILNMIEVWYNTGVAADIPEELLRYLKPQATEFKAIVSMSAQGIIDWTGIRCCMNAQGEIRHLANGIFREALGAAPDLFANAGPNCKRLGYCPENDRQHPSCKKAGVLTLSEMKRRASEYTWMICDYRDDMGR